MPSWTNLRQHRCSGYCKVRCAAGNPKEQGQHLIKVIAWRISATRLGENRMMVVAPRAQGLRHPPVTGWHHAFREHVVLTLPGAAMILPKEGVEVKWRFSRLMSFINEINKILGDNDPRMGVLYRLVSYHMFFYHQWKGIFLSSRNIGNLINQTGYIKRHKRLKRKVVYYYLHILIYLVGFPRLPR